MSCLAINVAECAACAACSCFSSALNWSMSQAARFSHFLIIIIVFVLAKVLGDSYPNTINGYNDYSEIDLTSNCNSTYQDNCIYDQLIYRASAALTILFCLLAVGSSFSDSINKGFWVLKLGIAVCLFVSFWWADNGFFNGWAQTSRFISFFWLLVQGLLFLDFSHDLHEILMANADEAEKKGSDSRWVYVTYLLLSLGSFAAAIVGLVFLFKDYTGCSLGMFFTILTLIVGVLTTIISLLNSVNRGLLTPSVMFAYSVFLCWYALLSNPDETCNPYAGDTSGAKVSTATSPSFFIIHSTVCGHDRRHCGVGLRALVLRLQWHKDIEYFQSRGERSTSHQSLRSHDIRVKV